MISVSGVQKSFGSLRAVDGVTFQLPRGKTLGLLGPNGAGKSTTMALLTGLLTPDAGTISMGDVGAPQLAEARRLMGLAPQSLALYENLTGFENAAFFGEIYGLRGARLRERAAWALSFVGLDQRSKDRAGTYSGGMQRRLNLACALVHEPAVLLLDEPTVGVDPQSRNHLLENILQLKRDGMTILYTTHYMEEAEKLCDSIAIMDHGKILAEGTLAELVDRHGGKSVVEMELKSEPKADMALPGTVNARHLRFESDDPSAEIYRLSREGIEFAALHVHRPTLEDVFLKLTGRSLRD
jgi:ABC-2 type transport system ATP-binding protein